MRVIVTFDPAANQELIKLLEPLTPTPGDALLFAQVYATDLVDVFRRHQGAPPDAERVVDANGVVWWWKYVKGVWVEFTVDDQSGWFLGGRVLAVRVIGFEAGPPPHGVRPGTVGT